MYARESLRCLCAVCASCVCASVCVSVLVTLAQYDWRLPPHRLEERDHYFTNLRATIDKMCKDNKKPVVVLCHSYACRVL